MVAEYIPLDLSMSSKFSMLFVVFCHVFNFSSSAFCAFCLMRSAASTREACDRCFCFRERYELNAFFVCVSVGFFGAMIVVT